MCIYKDMEDWDNVNEITEKYFTIEDGHNEEEEIELE